MKKTILILIAPLILLLFLGAQKSIQLDKFTKLSDKTYLYNSEVSVEEYYQFLKANNFAGSLLPDTSVFKDTAIFGDQIIPIGFSKKYFSSEYNQYPIVGITPTQAEQYCKWLTDKLDSQGSYKDKIKEVRLPTLNEYYSILLKEEVEVIFYSENESYSKFQRTNEKDPNKFTNLCTINLGKTINKQGSFNENLSGNLDAYSHLCPINAYNPKGCQNLIGNVSEFVYMKHRGSSIIPIGNNFTGEIQYNGKLSNPLYFIFDENLLADNEKWYIASAKVGFRFVIVLKD